MAKVSKREMVESFPELQRKANWLERYFWDSRAGRKPDAQVSERTERGDKCKVSVYGTARGDGGYVVVEWNPGTPGILGWEQWADQVRRAPYGGIGDVESLYKRAVEQLSRMLNATRDRDGLCVGCGAPESEAHDTVCPVIG